MASEQDILAGLVQRGIPQHIAAGIVQNMTAESGLRTDINEISPTVPGSRGGYGLNQWTGPRRVQFEQFAAQKGVDPSDLDAQLDFTLWELNNSEQRAGSAILGAGTTEDAARLYETMFLRPGIPHGSQGQNAIRQPPQQNALAEQQPENAFARYQPQQQDVRNFLTPQNSAPLQRFK